MKNDIMITGPGIIISKHAIGVIRPYDNRHRILKAPGFRFRLAQPTDLSELARLRMEQVGLDSRETCQAKADFCQSFEKFLVRRR